jgi:hypothetical protein
MMAQGEDGPQPQRQQQPILVEDIPSHEIYTSLLGIKRRSPSPAVVAVPSASWNNATTAPIVEMEHDRQKIIPTTAFGQTYAKSQETQLTSLFLDRSNKGFEILTKIGWREQEGGLGKKRQGSLLPIKTVLKGEGKKGIGAGKQKTARITHRFQKKETVQDDQKETKAQRNRRRHLERGEASRQDKRIRMMLRTDVSDEYEQLYTKLH